MPKQEIKEEDFQKSVDTQVSDALVEKLLGSSSEFTNNSGKHYLPRTGEEQPTITLNTRIPKTLSGKIDELIYLNKRNGIRETKQSVTIKALTKFLNPELARFDK